jgi:hypothetical protein
VLKRKSYACGIGRNELAKTYAVIKNCIPGHTYYMVSNLYWDKDFPKAWPYETEDEIETVNSIAKWYSSDPDLGRIEVAKANVTSVVFKAKYKGDKCDLYDLVGGVHPSSYVLNRTSPATQFISIMNEHNNRKFWINGSEIYEKDVPQLLPYEEKHEKDMANKIADTYAMINGTGDVSLVMVNITKPVKSFNEKKRAKRDLAAAAPKLKKKGVPDAGQTD